MSTDLAIVSLGPFADTRSPVSLDARCARKMLAWTDRRPLCCPRGAFVDARTKLELAKLGVPVAFAGELPVLAEGAGSGVLERLADARREGQVACGALDPGISGGGVLGEGCTLRQHALVHDLPEDRFLEHDCALFPLDLRDGTLVPSSRIAAEALVDLPIDDHDARSLWDLARPRVALRFGVDVARAIDVVAMGLRTRKAPHGLHLKTVK